MILSVHQPNFLPWLGYFNKIYKSDVFVFLDDVQLPQGRSVATRNKIKSSTGEEVLVTVPVKRGGLQSYNRVEIDYTQSWQSKTCKTIANYYRKAPYFSEVYDFVESHLMKVYSDLAAMNADFIGSLCKRLNIDTELKYCSVLQLSETKNDRIISICKHFGADVYLSGQGAKKYNDEAAYAAQGISIQYQEYNQPEYAQINGPYIPNLSAIDALFNTGFAATGNLVKTHSTI